MKKRISLLLILALAVSLVPAAFGANIVLSSQKFTLDGKPVNIEAYNIDGSNYVRLRSLASVLSGTDKQFSVEYLADQKLVVIHPGEAYTEGEGAHSGFAVLTDKDGRVTNAVKSSQSVMIGEAPYSFDAWNIGGSNYFRLAELQTHLGYDLSYDKSTRTVSIHTGDASPESRELSPADGYGEVYASVKAARSGLSSPTRGPGAAAEDVAADSALPSPTEPGGGGDGGYSGTNVQVEGIDEGDVVKTDGTYLYILRAGKLILMRADGAKTRTLSTTTVGISEYADGEHATRSTDKSPEELYVFGDRVAVLSHFYEYTYKDFDGERSWEDKEYTAVDIYDVSNPASPKLAASLGQDGYSMGSRLDGGVVYLVTDYSVYDADEDDPPSFVPCLYRGGKAEAVAAGDIWLRGHGGSSRYTVVTAYDLASGSVKATKSVLGGGNNLYMSRESIYVADSHYEGTESAPRKESVYTVVEHRYERKTEITRFDISSGLAVAAGGFVPGGLDDQFSMDEYQGHLRLVTTTGGYSYTSYTDEEMDFENIKWGEETESSNGLYILDSALSVVGKVDDLAKGERIYSARFDGEIAYFCTFRNVDPLFAVDVSDPAKPAVLSALKISGFSQYLHPWTDGRLFGAGYEADEENGRVKTVKLVMFDTGDKTDVTAKNTLVTDISSSEATYNHKAFLISFDRGLIAFPGDESYYIYSYDDSTGFLQRAEVELDGWSYHSRGLYIGDMIYVVGSKQVTVIDMSSFARVASVALPE